MNEYIHVIQAEDCDYTACGVPVLDDRILLCLTAEEAVEASGRGELDDCGCYVCLTKIGALP